MKGHVEQHTQDSQWSAKTEGKQHDAAVVNARVGEQATEAPLHQNEWNRYSHRKQTKNDEEL